MFRNMVTSLLEHERIYTTIPKAKELRRFADWMITLGKQGDLHARRQSLAFIRDKGVVHKLFADLAERYQNRPGGYTRIVKAGFRRGDAAPMCLIELVTDSGAPSKKVKPKFEQTSDKPVRSEATAAVAEGGAGSENA
jgi:large subunit ribosomal protein L17